MNWKHGLTHPGVLAALIAALLFGSSTPLAKWLLSNINPWLLAGLFYLGSGIGLSLYRLARRARAGTLSASEWPWLIGAILAGGIVAPVLLMFGLSKMPASGVSLLLNMEGVFTTLLAWFAFRENFDRRIIFGMIAIVAGTALLSWPEQIQFSTLWPALAIVGACLAWGIDNNLTRKVSLADTTWVVAIKGLIAGSVNVTIAFILGATWPPLTTMMATLFIGWLAYGISLSLFIVGLRHLGTARTVAYFSVAPFFGAALAIPLLGEPLSIRIAISGTLMALGIWLHLTEQHRHEHIHEMLDHEHEHSHDEHHSHKHPAISPTNKHRHQHRHEPLIHTHPHFPDTHHRHQH